MRGLGYSLEDPKLAIQAAEASSPFPHALSGAAIWTVLGLAPGGGVLSNAFRVAAETISMPRFPADMDGLIAAAEPIRIAG